MHLLCQKIILNKHIVFKTPSQERERETVWIFCICYKTWVICCYIEIVLHFYLRNDVQVLALLTIILRLDFFWLCQCFPLILGLFKVTFVFIILFLSIFVPHCWIYCSSFELIAPEKASCNKKTLFSIFASKDDKTKISFRSFILYYGVMLSGCVTGYQFIFYILNISHISQVIYNVGTIELNIA
jgi:hypothetical protein